MRENRWIANCTKNVFKIIFGNIDLHVHYRNIISCRVSSIWAHFSGFSPNGEFDSLLSLPLSASRLLQKAKAACSAAGKQGLGVQELYIAPPWRCAHTSTHTNVHAEFGMNKWETVAALHPPSFASPQLFSIFQSRVSSVRESDAASNFSAVLLPTASNNLTPARTGTGPTTTSQMRSTTKATSQPGEPIRAIQAITWLWESSRINPHFRN